MIRHVTFGYHVSWWALVFRWCWSRIESLVCWRSQDYIKISEDISGHHIRQGFSLSEAVARVYKAMALRPHTTIRSRLVDSKDKINTEATLLKSVFTGSRAKTVRKFTLEKRYVVSESG